MARFAKIYWLSVLCFVFHATVAECGQNVVYPAIGLRDIQGIDVYAEASVIHAAVVGKPHDSDEIAVAYVASRDAGASWGKLSIVSRAADGRVISRRGNDAQVAAAGRRVAVAFRHGGELPEAGPMVIAYSADGGASWRRGGNPASGDVTENQSYLDLAADQTGQFHLVWLDDREERGNTQGLRYAQSGDSGRHWRKETTLDPAVCTCCWNRLTVLPDRSVAALYRDDAPHDMRLLLRPANGGKWQDRGAVGTFDWRFDGCPHCGGGIASGPGGRLHGVVWSGKEGAAGLYYLQSADRGGHWSPPLRIGDGNSRESDIAVLADGRVGVVFASMDGLTFLQSADAGAHWSAPNRLSADGAVPDHPRIVATPGGFRVFWTEKQASGGKVWAMYAFDRTQ